MRRKMQCFCGSLGPVEMGNVRCTKPIVWSPIGYWFCEEHSQPFFKFAETLHVRPLTSLLKTEGGAKEKSALPDK